MLELAFEYLLSVIDYSCLLYFYLLLIDREWKWKKVIPAILLISLFQLCKDYLMDFGGWSLFIDCFIVVGFLFLYNFKFNVLDLLCAMLTYSVFKCCIVFFVGTAIELGVDVDASLSFGIERMIFSFFLKLFILSVYIVIIKYLKKLKTILPKQILNKILFIDSLILMVISIIYGDADGNDTIIIYVLFTLVMFVFIMYLIYKYCFILKENENLSLVKQSIELTAQYTKNLENEFDRVKKVRHDMKNQLMILSELQNDGQYNEVKEILSTLTNELDSSKQSISGNVYIDAILRQKQEQYKDIVFDMDIAIDKDFQIDGTDIISLLSNIIDNACEELKRVNETTFSLILKGKKSILEIKESNACRSNIDLKTDKDSEFHGYGLKIISEIVKKYEGELTIDTNDKFSISILMIL